MADTPLRPVDGDPDTDPDVASLDEARQARVGRPRADMSAREKRRYVRAASRRRVRGGDDVAPVVLQTAARRVDDVAHVGLDRVRRMLAGDRALWIGLAAMVAVAAIVLANPVRSFVEQRGRVELAQQQLAALEEANDGLRDRAADLTDLDYVEVLARERLGYVKPGQIAYSLVPPEEPESPDDVQGADVAAEPEPSSWWSRLWSGLTD